MASSTYSDLISECAKLKLAYDNGELGKDCNFKEFIDFVYTLAYKRAEVKDDEIDYTFFMFKINNRNHPSISTVEVILRQMIKNESNAIAPLPVVPPSVKPSIPVHKVELKTSDIGCVDNTVIVTRWKGPISGDLFKLVITPKLKDVDLINEITSYVQAPNIGTVSPRACEGYIENIMIKIRKYYENKLSR